MARPNQTPQTDRPPPTTVRLQNVAQSYGQSAALMAAVEVGVFTAISKGAGTYAEVAAPGHWGPAYWGLRQAVEDSLGLAHSEADVTGYFLAAGFVDVGVHEFIPGSLSRIAGTNAQ